MVATPSMEGSFILFFLPVLTGALATTGGLVVPRTCLAVLVTGRVYEIERNVFP